MANNASAVVDNTALTDYFIHENGVSFAGRHLLVDLWTPGNLQTSITSKTLCAGQRMPRVQPC